MMLFVFPFIIQRSLATLRYVSLFIVAAVIYTVVVAATNLPARVCSVPELLPDLQGQQRLQRRVLQQAV